MGSCPICGHEGELGAICPEHPTCCLADPLQLEEYEDDDVLLGHVLLDRFGLVRVLGKGGMGWVYEAVQMPIGRQVAFKLLRADYVDDELVRKRFFREARALGMLQHPNLVTLYDYGVVQLGEDQSLFIAMELLRGRTLGSALQRPRSFGVARALAALRGVAAGLAEAHRNGIVHRDLKPDNILLVRDTNHREVAKVVDFGIARLSTSNTVLTQAGMVFGTPAYMSPEQAAGDTNIKPAADVYSFGVLLYRILAGHLPFTGDTPLQVLMKHMNKPTPPLELRPGLEVPGALIELTYHCMQKHPSERPEDASELERRLADIAVELQEGVDLIAGPTLQDLDAAPSDPGIPELDDGDTWVVGGDVEMLDGQTNPQAEAQEEGPTQGALPAAAAAAYRVGSGGTMPAALREAGRIDPLPYMIGSIVLLVVLGLAGYFIFGGSDDGGSDDGGSDAASSSSTSDETTGRETPETKANRGTDESPATSHEAAPGEGVTPKADAPAVNPKAALLAELDRLRMARETTLTIIDRGEQARRQKELSQKIIAIEDALRELGVAVPQE